jgi:hypothetical protein
MNKPVHTATLLVALTSLFFVGCTISTLSARPSPDATARKVERSLDRMDARDPASVPASQSEQK